MFKKEDMHNIKDTETIIGESVILEGDFNGHGNVVVEGKLNGSFSTDGHVLVGENAEINANITAKSAFISGKISGNINVEESLDIARTAFIKGDIKAQSIAVESGCEINGNVKIGGLGDKQMQINTKARNEKKEELE